MKCFLEVIVRRRMIIWIFAYAMWPVNAKKTFPMQFCEIFLKYRIAWKTTSCKRKNFFAIYGSFCEIDVFPFSFCNFNLRNLKGNGNAVYGVHHWTDFSLDSHHAEAFKRCSYSIVTSDAARVPLKENKHSWQRQKSSKPSTAVLWPRFPK